MPPTFLWIDDLRDPQEHLPSWDRNKYLTWAKTADEALFHLKTGTVGRVSFDNDLGEDQPQGLDLFTRLEAWIEDGTVSRIPAMQVHSANPVARRSLEQAIRRLYQRQSGLGEGATFPDLFILPPTETFALTRAFPGLCRNLFTGPMPKGFAVEPGWVPILHEAFTALETLTQDPPLPLVLFQVKEKFGGLRIYLDLADGKADDHGGWEKRLTLTAPQTMDKIKSTLEHACTIASHTCEACGENGSLFQVKTYAQTLCPSCAEERGASHVTP